MTTGYKLIIAPIIVGSLIFTNLMGYVISFMEKLPSPKQSVINAARSPNYGIDIVHRTGLETTPQANSFERAMRVWREMWAVHRDS